MPEKIAWSISARIDGGPQISKSEIIEVEAYEKFDLVLPKSGKSTVEVQLGEGLAKFVLIAATKYTKISFAVDGGTPIALDAPMMLIGAGAVNLLGKKLNTLDFENGNIEDVSIMMLVAGKAVR